MRTDPQAAIDLPVRTRRTFRLPKSFRELEVVVAVTGVAAVVLFLIVFPVFSVLFESVRDPEGGLTLDRYRRFFGSTYFRHTLYNTLLISGIATVTSMVLGFAFAYAVTRANLPFKAFFAAIVLVPMLLPPFLIAFSLILLLGRNGVINKALYGFGDFLNLANPAALQWVVYGSKGVILAQTLTFFPIAFLIFTAALSAINPQMEEAAEDLGGNYWYVLRRVTLPLLTPATLSAGLLIFMFNASAYGAPAVLGGGQLFFPNATMITPEAIIQILGLLDWGMGTTIAVILIVPSLIVYFLSEYFLKKRSYITVTGTPSAFERRPVPKYVKRTLFVVCALTALMVLAIVVVVIFGAFTQTWGVNYSFTLRHLHIALAASSSSIYNSLVLAIGGAIIAALFGVIAAFLYLRKPFPGVRILDFSSMLPYALPGVVLGLSYALAFGGRIGFLVLSGTWIIIVLNHVIRRMPFAIRSGSSALSQIDPQIDEAAADLGGRPAYSFIRVTLPLLRATLLAAFIFGFVNMMTDITAVVFLASPQWRLLSIDLFNAIDSGRLGVAAALSLVMIVSTFVVVFIGWLLGGRGFNMLRN